MFYATFDLKDIAALKEEDYSAKRETLAGVFQYANVIFERPESVADYFDAWGSEFHSQFGARTFVRYPRDKARGLADKLDGDINTYLDLGFAGVCLPLSMYACMNDLPTDRFIFYVDADDFEAPYGVEVDPAFAAGLDSRGAILIYGRGTVNLIEDGISKLRFFCSEYGVDLIIPCEDSFYGGCSYYSSHGFADLDNVFADFLDCLHFAENGLIPTAVVGPHGKLLGQVYSSKESIKTAVETGTGVYYSRSRKEIWVKGKTSGDTQKLLAIDTDCDYDSLVFTVEQEGKGFCHLKTKSCFSNVSRSKGLVGLQDTLQNRLQFARDDSYTRKLFNNPTLLHDKIMEEAQEMCDAESKEDIAAEAADVFYFALVKCIKNGVSLQDIEKIFDQRALAITKRPGLSKNPAINATIDKTYAAREVDLRDRVPSDLYKRPALDLSAVKEVVAPIIKQVKRSGDAAVKKYTLKFDSVELDSHIVKAPFPKSMWSSLNPKVRDAIRTAYNNIRKFHMKQVKKSGSRGLEESETTPGVVCWRERRPIEAVGLYVPGGSAVLPSTALMLGVPSQIAGCKTVVLACPPDKDGKISPEVAFAAHLVGVTHLFKCGGAQAIAAMAWGTETVPKVYKICGPGNQFVTVAKMELQSDPEALVAIDMPAGPSEVLVIADSSCDPVFVASDLLSQAEHGKDSQVVLLEVGVSDEVHFMIKAEVARQGNLLPRSEIVSHSLQKSLVIRFDELAKAIQFSNKYAPEHLILHLHNYRDALKDVMNAGSVFLGSYTPESCGDYASGTNHTLPTSGYAKMYGGVSVDTFNKYMTVQEISKEGLLRLGDTVATLAKAEGLEAHRQAVLLRTKKIMGNAISEKEQ